MPLTALESCLATTSHRNYYLRGIYQASDGTKRAKQQNIKYFHGLKSSAYDTLPSQVRNEDLPSIPNVKDLHGPVRRTGRQASAIVIHLSIVLQGDEEAAVSACECCFVNRSCNF